MHITFIACVFWLRDRKNYMLSIKIIFHCFTCPSTFDPHLQTLDLASFATLTIPVTIIVLCTPTQLCRTVFSKHLSHNIRSPSSRWGWLIVLITNIQLLPPVIIIHHLHICQSLVMIKGFRSLPLNNIEKYTSVNNKQPQSIFRIQSHIDKHVKVLLLNLLTSVLGGSDWMCLTMHLLFHLCHCKYCNIKVWCSSIISM